MVGISVGRAIPSTDIEFLKSSSYLEIAAAISRLVKVNAKPTNNGL